MNLSMTSPTKILPRRGRHASCRVLFLGLVCTLVNTSSTFAKSPAHGEAAETKESGAAHEAIGQLSLGNIEIKNLEPANNQTTTMAFDLYLSFPPDTSSESIAALKHWKHRLRHQAIVAVRISELADFADPELKRFRKQILYRVNRMLKAPAAIDVLLANFTYSTN